ncbi:MAG: tRNA-specific adenosine deaminase [Clostridiales bacterium]|nr:MAG: tRNA-specific adenosine deaminase [Clostridiales bacterium]
MKLALLQAKKAYEIGEVPVGCIAVKDKEVIARAYNKKEIMNDPTMHAEILLIKKLSKKRKSWRLNDGITIYSTLEPCIMCMGALLHARIDRLVFGAYDKKFGAAQSLYKLASDNRLNHNFTVLGGVLEEESITMLKEFFKNLRNKEK